MRYLPLLASPFVRLYGLNCLLSSQCSVLAVAVSAPRVSGGNAPPVSAAFSPRPFGAAALPVYGRSDPDVFNLVVVLWRTSLVYQESALRTSG